MVPGDIDATITGNKLIIREGGKRVEHKGFAILEAYSSPRTKTVYFLQAERHIPSRLEEYKYTDYRIWRWSRATGFRTLTLPFPHLSDLSLSVKGDTLLAKLDSESRESKTRLVTCSLSDLATEVLPMPALPGDHGLMGVDTVMVGKNDFLVTEYQTGVRKVWRWNPATSRKEELKIGGDIQSVAAFDGLVWATCPTSDGTWHVLKLSPSVDRVLSDQPIEISVSSLP